MSLWLALALLTPAPASAERLLKALTYNVAGIPIVHAHWPQRRSAIGHRLREGGYDLVALQEAWLDQDSRALAEISGLSYYTRYARRISLGTGLAILSRYPILEKRERPFTCRPSVLRWMSGEAIANKGVLMVRVQTPKGPLDVYTAHLVAEYPSGKHPTLRLTQIYELAEMVLELSAGRPFLILGDLNTKPGDPAYQALVDLLGLEDPCFEKGSEVCGGTNSINARIDHVLVPRGMARWVRSRTAFKGTLPGTKTPYSDHLAVESDLDAKFLTSAPAPEAGPRQATLKLLEHKIRRMTDAMFARQQARSWIPVYGFLLSARYEHQRAQLSAIASRMESNRIRLVQAKR